LYHPRTTLFPYTTLFRSLKDNGTIRSKEISLSTVNRVVNRLKKEDTPTRNRDMRRYERKHINEVWCGDSSVGPYLKIDGKKERTDRKSTRLNSSHVSMSY